MGMPGQRIIIEGSTDWSGWLPVETNTLPFAQPATWSFIDALSEGMPQRFYRARLASQ
jgi:hypothetical protein